MDECLAYFRRAIHDPASVVPWSQWWAANADLVAHSFGFADYVRLKHRRLRGARQILQKAGELPPDFRPQNVEESGSCPDCGERATSNAAVLGSGHVTCVTCGGAYIFDTSEANDPPPGDPLAGKPPPTEPQSS
jgi:hypothetical protein